MMIMTVAASIFMIVRERCAPSIWRALRHWRPKDALLRSFDAPDCSEPEIGRIVPGIVPVAFDPTCPRRRPLGWRCYRLRIARHVALRPPQHSETGRRPAGSLRARLWQLPGVAARL